MSFVIPEAPTFLECQKTTAGKKVMYLVIDFCVSRCIVRIEAMCSTFELNDKKHPFRYNHYFDAFPDSKDREFKVNPYPLSHQPAWRGWRWKSAG